MRTNYSIKTTWDILVASDIHLRSTIPINRKDPDFIESMWIKWSFLLQTAHKLNVPVLIAGDLGDNSKWGEETLNMFWNIYNVFPVDMIILPGQHDLPNHSLKNIEQSALGVIDKMRGDFQIIKKSMITCREYTSGLGLRFYCIPFGEDLEYAEDMQKTQSDQHNILAFHDMVIKSKPTWPGQTAMKSKSLLKKYKRADLIVTGDNHIPFVDTYHGRHLINSGSMLRTRIDQRKHRPRFYLYSFQCREYKPVYWPIKKNVFSVSTKKETEKPLDIDSFFYKLRKTEGVDLSFKSNMKAYVDKHTTRKEVRDKLRKAGAL